MERLLLDVMYDLPTEKNVIKVVIDENTVTNESKPLLIYQDEQKSAARD